MFFTKKKIIKLAIKQKSKSFYRKFHNFFGNGHVDYIYKTDVKLQQEKINLGQDQKNPWNN